MRLGQLSGLVCAFLYLIAVTAPLLLGAEPAHALSWALYYEIGRTFSLLNIAGEAKSLSWLWFMVFTLSVVIFVVCGNFMYLALRSRFFQYRSYLRAQKAERKTNS